MADTRWPLSGKVTRSCSIRPACQRGGLRTSHSSRTRRQMRSRTQRGRAAEFLCRHQSCVVALISVLTGITCSVENPYFNRKRISAARSRPGKPKTIPARFGEAGKTARETSRRRDQSKETAPAGLFVGALPPGLTRIISKILSVKQAFHRLRQCVRWIG